ncbi:MAG: Fic family protein [Deltaproteobacteria bacterium]|nr:Fic family protein [Deltaproteobacteria bacterium]
MSQRDIYKDIDDRTDELRELASRYPEIWDDFVAKFELSWIYHENALEGCVLAHAEITSALKGRPISPETYGPIRSLKLSMDQLRREALSGGKIDMALARRLHAVLGSSDPEFQPTRYRKDIPLHRAYFHDIAQPAAIPTRIAKLLDWAAEHDPDDDDAIRFAAHFHHEFMSIFPFAEHTGKTGRLLVNFILLRHGYMPVLFHATERQRYYDTLRLSKKEMELLLNDMMANCIDNGTKFIEHELEQREKVRTLRLARS